MAHEKSFFLNLRHVFDQFRERAHAPHWTDEKIETRLREILEEALEKDSFLENRITGEKLCRVAIPGLEVVYAQLQPGHSDGRYRWMIHTLFSQEMYHQWSKEARIGTLGERITEKDEQKIRDAIKNHTPVKVKMEAKNEEEGGETMFLIEFKKANGTQSIKLPQSKVSDYILSLLKSGTALKDITVYKPTEFKLSVEFGGG